MALLPVMAIIVLNESNSAFAFSTGLIYGETVTFEYYQPETVREEAIISIARIDYGYRYVNNPYTPRTRPFNDSGDCQVNVNCPEGANWRMEKDAIARIMVVSDYGSGWCSCSLVNNTNNDNTPLRIDSKSLSAKLLRSKSVRCDQQSERLSMGFLLRV